MAWLHLTINTNDNPVVVNIKNIAFIVGGNKTTGIYIVQKDEPIIVRETLNEVLSQIIEGD